MPVRNIEIKASVLLPEDWGLGTALTRQSDPLTLNKSRSTLIQFAQTNVEQLEDSPVLVGHFFCARVHSLVEWKVSAANAALSA